MRLAGMMLVLLVCFPTTLLADDSPIVFSDDFSTLRPGWGAASDSLSVAGGKLVITPSAGNGYTALYAGNQFGDVDVSVKISQTSGNNDQPAGICFWASDPDNKYIAQIQSDGNFAVSRFQADQWLNPVPWAVRAEVNQGLGQVNELRVVTQGRLATVYVNGKQMVSFQGFPPAGQCQVGLYAASGPQSYTWQFSSFVVRRPAATQPPAAPADPSVLFSDKFSTLDPAWGPADDQHNAAAGNMVVQPVANGAFTMLYEGSNFGDMDVSVTVTQMNGALTDSPAGVVFWAADVNNCYVAEIQGDGRFGVARSTAGNWLYAAPLNAQPAVKQGLGQQNVIRVVTSGRSATVYVNGTQVTSFTGFPPTGGSQVGLHAEAGAVVYAWRFANLVVRQPAASQAPVSPMAPADPSVLFSDNFSTLDPARGATDQQLSVAGGKLVIAAKANGTYTALNQGSSFGDADISVKITQASGNPDSPAGISFWATDAINEYVALLQGDGNFAVLRCQANQWLFPVNWSVQPAVKKGLNQVNELRVVTQGRTATVYINGTQVTSFIGYPPSSPSQIGLYRESGAQSYTWQFANLVVRQPRASQSPVAAPAPADSGVLLSDNFATLNRAWTGGGSAEMNVAGGKMVFNPDANHSFTSLYGASSFGDVDIRVKFTQTKGNSDMPAGISFWAEDFENQYAAVLQTNGSFAVNRMQDGRWLDPVGWSVQPAASKGLNQVNELRVVTQGRTATVYINGTQVTAFDGFPPAGNSKIGLLASSGQQVYTWQFADFVVRKPAPSQSPAASSPPIPPGVLFLDNFARLDPSWGIVAGQLSAAGGKMTIKPAAGGYVVPIYQGARFQDVDMSVNITQTGGSSVAGSEAALVFWANDYKNFYMASIQSDGDFSVPRNSASTWLHPVSWQASAAVKRGLNQVNEVRVVTKGTTATVFINGTQVASFTGFPPQGGCQVGVYAGCAANEAGTWTFSDFTVRTPK